MANNRMFLVHPGGVKITLAKYYPSTGWYVPDGRIELLNRAFDEIDFKGGLVNPSTGARTSDYGMRGDTSWTLEYE